MGFLDIVREKAKTDPKRIVLPEGEDRRIVEASSYISKSKIAEITLLKEGINIDGFDKMVDEFFQICRQKKREMTREEVERLLVKDRLYMAGMMVRLGMADGFVAGASHKTSCVARAALRCLELDPSIKVMSGAFVMEIPGSNYGYKGVFIFSDCGIVPFPNREQLAGIAIAACKFAKRILEVEPKVAMLSYSTKGSAATPNLDVVREAVELVKRSHPEIKIDGELQVDAALDPEAARIKHSVLESDVAGKANVLIFPNLDSGNIAYKLVQRLARARAVGPLLLGLQNPASDLSRACSVDDIVDAVAITSVMAQ